MDGKKYPTPHIKAEPGDIAKVILMPGDPMRSEYMAEKFLENPVLFNNVRGVRGYTGMYGGKRVSVMASGMGMPSMGIYSYELFNFFGVEAILRVGSAGSMREDVRLRDIVFAMGACTDIPLVPSCTYAPVADYGLLRTAVRKAEERHVKYHVGNVLSSNKFYDTDPKEDEMWRSLGVMAVEMECAALYMNAAKAGKKALAVCTVSDDRFRNEVMTSEERERSLDEMIGLVFDVAAEITKCD